MRENKRQIGTREEERAARYLRENGYRIREHSYRCRIGEIDLIAEKDGMIIFCEVKYRTGPGAGSPLAAVDRRKQETIFRVAQQYLLAKGLPEETPCRFDVIGLTQDRVLHIENAFGGL